MGTWRPVPVSVTAVLLVVSVAAPSRAADVAARSSPFEIRSPDGALTLRFKGRIQVDFGWVRDRHDATSDGTSTGARFGSQHEIEVRSVQFGIQGEVYDWLFYKAGGIRVSGKTKLTTTYVEFRRGDFHLDLGQSRAAVAMEEETGSTNISFLERAAFTDAWDFRRRVGIGLDYETRHFVLETALQTDNVLQAWPERDRYAVSARAILLPVTQQDRMLHLAAYVMKRRRKRNPPGLGPPIIRYDQRPEIHPIDQRFTDTGDIPAKGDHVYGFEVAGLSGPWNATAEVSFLTVDSLTPSRPKPHFWGGYAEIGYFVTGESRPYTGLKWGHLNPLRPIGSGGFGALELVVRIDTVDLEDRPAQVLGGRQVAYLLGVNWYPVDRIRVMADFGIMSVADGPYFRNAAGRDTVDIVGLRGQLNW